MADPTCPTCSAPSRIIAVEDGKPVYVYDPVKTDAWNKSEIGKWAMNLIQVVILAYVAKLGWQADTKADKAAVSSEVAAVKATDAATKAVELESKVDTGIEQGRANHVAIRETKIEVDKVSSKVGAKPKSP